jgi:O-antigen/teichoic acid export membrane protein
VPAAKRVGSNIVEILLFRGLSTPLALGLVVLQGRLLAPDGRGAFVLAVLTVTIFSRLLSQLGVAVANHMPSEEWDEPPELRRLVLRSFALAAALGVLGAALIVGIGALTPSVGVGTAAVAAVALVPNALWQTASGVLLGLGRIRPWNWVQLCSPLVTVAATVVLVGLLHGQVRAALAAWVAAHVLTAALALWLTRDVWHPFALEQILDAVGRTLARLALAMGAMQVISLIGYRAELFVLEAVDGVGAVGVYSVANQAAESMWLVAAAIATAITAPVVHADAAAAAAIVRRSVLRALAYTGAVAAVVALVAPFAIPSALGADFEGASSPLLLLLPGAVAYAPVQVLVVYLSVRRGRAWLSLACGLVAMTVTVASSFPLIVEFGASGAAGASALGYACGATAAWLAFRRLSRDEQR